MFKCKCIQNLTFRRERDNPYNMADIKFEKQLDRIDILLEKSKALGRQFSKQFWGIDDSHTELERKDLLARLTGEELLIRAGSEVKPEII